MMKFLLGLFTVLFVFTGSFAQIPSGYYTGTDGKTGDELKEILYNIIKGHKEYEYTSSSTDTWDILKEADRDPDNSDNVLCFYSGFSRDAEEEYNSGAGWSREHIWAKSRGDFGTDKGPGTDAHHLRAADVSTNSARSNRNFNECDQQYVDGDGTTNSYKCTGEFSWEPPVEVQGDVARMLFYMATRYEGFNGEPDLELTDELLSQDSKEPLQAKLSVLLQWHEDDPVDEAEESRNEVIYSYQGNRNPYIDHPEYVDLIWGSGEIDDEDDNTEEEETEDEVLSVADLPIHELYPNPASDEVLLSAELNVFSVYLYDLKGGLQLSVISEKRIGRIDVSTLSEGTYILKLVKDGEFRNYKIIVDRN